MDEFKRNCFEKIENCAELTEEELQKLVYLCAVETNYGDSRARTSNAATVINLFRNFYIIEWQEGLAEGQRDRFPYQPYRAESPILPY